MSLNYYGILIFMLLLIPRLILVFFPPIRRVHHMAHKQLKVLETIGEVGCSFFGLITIFDIGYKPINFPVEVVWIVLATILFIIHYAFYFRYAIKGRKEEYLYDKVLVYSPIHLSKVLIYLISGILLFNPFIIVFSIMYGIPTLIINYKRNFEWGIYYVYV